MKRADVLRIGKSGLETFFSSIYFFYSHWTLILISFIPSLVRAYQMWNLNTTLWLEVIVECTRVILFLLMICLLSNCHVHDLMNKPFWKKLGESCSIQFKESWPHLFVAQVVIFVVLLYGVGNFILKMIVSGTLTSMIALLGIETYDPTAAYHAYLYFLKNISVIPLAMVFILKMGGVKPINPS